MATASPAPLKVLDRKQLIASACFFLEAFALVPELFEKLAKDDSSAYSSHLGRIKNALIDESKIATIERIDAPFLALIVTTIGDTPPFSTRLVSVQYLYLFG